MMSAKFSRNVLFVTRRQSILRRNSSTVIDLKPYDEIPGLPGKGLPYIGHMHLVTKKPHGVGKSWLNLELLIQKYLKSEDKLFRMNSGMFNPEGDGRFVILLDPNDVEKAHKNEGKYPSRGNAFGPWKFMREQRKDIFYETTGVLMEDDERWHDVRSKVQQDLMRPQSAHFYINDIKSISEEFINFIRQIRSREDKVVKNTLPELYRYTFESICCIALDTRIGCMKTPLDPEISEMFEASKAFLDSFLPLNLSPTWKIFPQPRWNKTFRTAQDNLDVLLNFSMKNVNIAKKRIAEKEIGDTQEMSVLQKMIIRNGLDSTYPLVTALDLLFAGIDTTGNTLGFLMYNLATNPEKQDKLRHECQGIGKDLTIKNLNELRYLKACIQETNRLTPTVPSFGRRICQDMNLHGYHIPKDTMVGWNAFLFRNQFPEPEKFIPERWLENKKEICPHAVRQFSHGPRMCIGKRFAELEMLIVIHKMMNNFEIKWAKKDPMTCSQVLVIAPDSTLDFQFNDL